VKINSTSLAAKC